MMRPMPGDSRQNTRDENAATDRTLIVATRVKDTAVYNTFGDKIGTIVDMLIERASGRVVYVLMSFGGFLGIGEKVHPLPWDVLRYNTEWKGYVIPFTKEELTNAPHYSSVELTSYGGEDSSYAEAVSSYYKQLARAE